MSFLYMITIYPLELIYKYIYLACVSVAGSYGVGLIVMSLVTFIVFVPLKGWAKKAADKERDIQDVLAPQIAKIQSESTGAERQERISKLYKRYSYHPVMAVRSAVGAGLQIPFLMAAYYMISNLKGLEGQSFWFVKDLSKPDALLFGLNLLPILMTLINFATTFTTKDMRKKDRIQAVVIALLFLALLYTAPSALLIYWTCNNILYLLENVKGFSFFRSVYAFLNKKKIKFDSNIKEAVWQISVALFFSLTVFLFVPLNFLIANYSELDIDFAVLVRKVILMAAVVFLISGAVSGALFHTNRKANKGFLSVLFVSGIFVFFEYLFIVPHIGQLNGEPFNIKDHMELAVADIFFLFLLISGIFVLFKKENFRSYLYKTSLVLVILQGFFFFTNPSLYSLETEQEGIYSFKHYDFDLNKYNTYSKNKNIAIVLMDGFGKGVFEELLIKYPEYKEIFKDFEFYPDTVSVNKSTTFAVPSVFQGYEPENGVHNEAYYTALKKGFSANEAMLNVLKKDGYTNYIYPLFSNLMYLHPSFMDNLVLAKKIRVPKHFYRKIIRNVVSFYAFPVPFKAASHKFLTKATLDKNSETQQHSPYVETDFYNKFKDAISTDNERKAFRFYHLRGLHEPYKLNERFEIENISTGKKDPVELTAKLYMTMLQNYLNRLKEAGIYDKTAIIFMSDHGTGRVLSPLQSEKETPVNSLLLYKNFNQKQEEMKTVSAIYPDVEDISDLVFYSAGIAKNKFSIRNEARNRGVLENARISQKGFLKNRRLKKEKLKRKISYEISAELYSHVLNGKNGTLTVHSMKSTQNNRFCLRKKTDVWCVDQTGGIPAADSSVYIQFDFIGDDLPEGKYTVLIIGKDGNEFYELKTPIKGVYVDKKISFLGENHE